LNHGFHGFHGLRILAPRRHRNTISTEANEGNKVPILYRDSFVIFVCFCSNEIRVIRAIRGKIRIGIVFATLRLGGFALKGLFLGILEQEQTEETENGKR